jgi:hypothetical protein
MHRQWRLRRPTRPSPDGQRRWNRAYQLLVEWTALDEPLHAAPSAPASVSARANQEGDHAYRLVSSRLDPATRPTADQ